MSPTTHELSLTAASDGDAGLAALGLTASAIWRPRGEKGFFTQIGVEPSIAVTHRENEPELAFPARIGVGWDSFYAPGSGDIA